MALYRFDREVYFDHPASEQGLIFPGAVELGLSSVDLPERQIDILATAALVQGAIELDQRLLILPHPRVCLSGMEQCVEMVWFVGQNFLEAFQGGSVITAGLLLQPLRVGIAKQLLLEINLNGRRRLGGVGGFDLCDHTLIGGRFLHLAAGIGCDGLIFSGRRIGQSGKI